MPPREDSSRPTVLTVGRIAASERYKGHDAILDVWPDVLRRVPDAEYLIVGDGDDRPRLESRVREMGITRLGALRRFGFTGGTGRLL